MQLAVDASVTVGEGLRPSRRAFLLHDDLELVATETVRGETVHELNRRVSIVVKRGVTSEEDGARTLADALATFEAAVTIRNPAFYEPFMPEALRRMPRDPSDAPTVALALALGCGIWTADADFCGCGVAVWSSEVLRARVNGSR